MTALELRRALWKTHQDHFAKHALDIPAFVVTSEQRSTLLRDRDTVMFNMEIEGPIEKLWGIPLVIAEPTVLAWRA